MLKKQKILGVPFVAASWSEVRQYLKQLIISEQKEIWVTANPEIVEKSYRDKELKNILQEAVVFPDGVGILWAGKVLKKPLPERLSGIDLIPLLKEYKVYLLGAKASVIKKAAEVLSAQGMNIVGGHPGYFNELEEEIIIKEIAKLKPQILLVGLGMGRQEKWLFRNFNKLNVNLGITVGGSFDVIAGKKKRAPKLIQRLNLEWLYRLWQEPKRIMRQLNLIKFVLRVIFFKRTLVP